MFLIISTFIKYNIINKDYLSTESSFYSRNQNNNKVIYKNENTEKKYFKVTVVNSNLKLNNSKDNIKENIKENYSY